MASTGSTETQVWKTLSQNPNLTAPQLAPLCKSISTKELVTALNSLLAKDLVKVAKTNDGKLTWKAVDVSDAKAKNAMAGDERMVYSAIEASGNQGIWSRTITNQTNLPNAVVTKILNKLMSSKQIKQVKAVNHPTRKMYMVSHIEPSVDLTGGPWYTDFELDPEFIGFVRSACLNFVSKKSFPDPEDDSLSAPLFPTTWVDRYPNLHDILRFVKSAKITDVNLLPDHIEEIMNILIYEGLVEKLPAVGGGGVGGAASRKADESDDEDSDESMSTGSRKRKHKTSKKRRGSDDESESEREEERKKKKRKKGRRSESEEEKSRHSDGERERSKKRKGSRKRNDSESDSDADHDHSSRHRGRDKKRKRDRSHTLSSGEDSDSDDDRRSKSRKKGRRGSGSEDSDDDRHKSSSRTSRKSKDKKGKDGEDDEKIDLDSAFGHLLNTGSVYRAIRPERVGLGWSQAPCARCPQLEFCEDGGPVNPTGCKYYGDWLAQALGD
ncbi:34-kDa subunit of RNA polymerase III (C) [Tulasnella sp. UAMH 9824]|nr:34-kDa subunit of RNA polymerase III (C) [Tulasnella sp. UAMH 9824]